MRLSRLGMEALCCSAVLTVAVATTACANGGTEDTSQTPAVQAASSGGQETTADSGATRGTGSSGGAYAAGAGTGTSGSSGGADASSTVTTGDDGAAATSSSGAGDDGATQPDVASSCVKGQVTPNQVVMAGDSYLDPAWGNVGPTLMTKANAMYRHYYIGGASLGWGNPNTQFFIPYQLDPMALTDPAVTNPADIKVIIMDGGGNDVLIGNTSCETTAPPSNTSCVTTVQNALDEVHSKLEEVAQKGVKWVVFFFYPHLSTAGGGILSNPAPAVNETLDYAYPLAEKTCCGSSFTSSLASYSCSGEPVPGVKCLFIDTRPAFEGHLADYIKSDNVHPTQAGADVIANLIWTQMQANCIAQ
jgi:hypothetical protein